MKKPNRSQLVGIILSAALIVAILVTGTFALILPNQHASNLFGIDDDSGETPSVKLVDEFPKGGIDDWKVGVPTDKKVSVYNDGSVPVYVKMQLKEYMGITSGAALNNYWKVSSDPHNPAIVPIGEKPSLFAIQDHPTLGEVFLVYPDPDGTAAVSAVKAWFTGKGYVANQVAYFTEAVNNQTGWFVVTEKGDKNGQYGRYAYAKDPAATGGGTFTQVGTKPLATCYHYDAHDSDHECDECKYDVRRWNAAGAIGTPSDKFMSYVKWILGGDVIYAADWVTGGTTLGGTTVAANSSGPFWIIGENGWVRWGEILQPNTYTSLFMAGVELLKKTNGNAKYVIHIDLTATTSFREFGDHDDDDGGGQIQTLPNPHNTTTGIIRPSNSALVLSVLNEEYIELNDVIGFYRLEFQTLLTENGVPVKNVSADEDTSYTLQVLYAGNQWLEPDAEYMTIGYDTDEEGVGHAFLFVFKNAWNFAEIPKAMMLSLRVTASYHGLISNEAFYDIIPR